MAEQMREAFRDETPQEAAERIWKETKHDPVETMRLFDEWAREEPERMVAIIGQGRWLGHVRTWLTGSSRDRHWKHGSAFEKAVESKAKRGHAESMRNWRKEKINGGGGFRTLRPHYQRDATRCKRDRIKRGVKVLKAEVDVATGQVVNLIDKEYGPFAHIRINGLRLPEITTEEALAHCDKKIADVRFIRALCHLIPDPRKPIGDQWTPEIIREAKKAAELRNE